ncbi:hypothetical protein SBA3_3770006 [Candidatus Sulfopaludibacter sp. SbA3]|nr:hypothetical protein SBA3_3770006 [Candidatus Sulfopaludibacter sp. SbA3]
MWLARSCGNTLAATGRRGKAKRVKLVASLMPFALPWTLHRSMAYEAH